MRVLGSAKRVMVLAGAGISVSAGVPDFRSADGVYNMVRTMELDLATPIVAPAAEASKSKSGPRSSRRRKKSDGRKVT